MGPGQPLPGITPMEQGRLTTAHARPLLIEPELAFYMGTSLKKTNFFLTTVFKQTLGDSIYSVN